MITPFDASGVARDPAGIKRYTDGPASVVHLLRSTMEAVPDQEAIVEQDGRRLSYQELWDAAVAGGLRAAGVGVAIRHGNGVDWVLSFFGTLLASGVAAPVNTRFTEAEVKYVVDDCTPAVVLEPGNSLPSGTPVTWPGSTTTASRTSWTASRT